MFRPCIDLHDGCVKQIVGRSLSGAPEDLKTNFVSDRSATWYAELYARDDLKGGHVIKLGPGNDTAARSALQAYPGGLQLGGGVTIENARDWLEAGASHVIVTSWAFRDRQVDWNRLKQLASVIGRERLVLDLSCRKREGDYFIVTDRWQTFTEVTIDEQSLGRFAEYATELLVHAADVEGLCQGVDLDLVRILARCSPVTTTYAGGARSIDDLERVTRESQGRIHLTIGSALDIFGGTGVRYEDVVAFNRRLRQA